MLFRSDWGLVDGVEVILFGSTDSETPIQRVAASGGVPQAATTNTPGERQTYPQFLPDGKRFFYLGRGGENSGIFVKSLSSGAPTFLLETPGRASFASDRLLYLRDNTLVAQQIDWSANKPVGEPLVVVDNVRSGLGNGRNAFSASQNGILSYRTNFFGNGTRHRWYSRAGKPGIATELGNNLGAEISPDGKRAAITTVLHLQIWILDTATGALSQIGRAHV